MHLYLLLLSIIATAHSLIQLPPFLSSGAILQTWRGYHVATHLYGQAAPGELVTVEASTPSTCSGKVPAFSALADSTGFFQLAYNWPPGPTCWDNFNLTFSGPSTPTPILLVGVRWGDVVVCLGDDSAALPLSQSDDAQAWLGSKGVAKELTYARVFTMGAGEGWLEATDPLATASFSALCLRTAVEATLTKGFGGNTVVGLISLVGGAAGGGAKGSKVEDWLPPAGVQALGGCPALPGAPPTPGTLWNNPQSGGASLAFYPARYFLVALGASDAGRLSAGTGDGGSGGSVAAAQAYACRLKALALGLRSGAAVGDTPVIFMEPLPGLVAAGGPVGGGVGGLAALRTAFSSLLPADPSGLWVGGDGGGVGAVTLGVSVGVGDTPGSTTNVTALSQRGALALVYTAWWAFTERTFGPTPRTATPSAIAYPGGQGVGVIEVSFAFAPGGNTTSSSLALLAMGDGGASTSSSGTPTHPTSSPSSPPTLLFEVSEDEGGGVWLPASAVSTGGAANRTLLISYNATSTGSGGAVWVRYGGAGVPTSTSLILVDALNTTLPSPAFIFKVGAAVEPRAVAAASAVKLPPLPPHISTTTTTTPSTVPFQSADDVDARRAYLIEGHRRTLAAAAQRAQGMPPLPPMAAPTPPMYWNSWQAFRCNLDEDLLRRTGSALVSSGLAGMGWRYVNMDDCEWRSERSEGGVGPVVPDETRFPSGIPALVAFLGSLTPPLSLGVYTSATASTCVGRPGSWGKEDLDAATYCGWGAGWVKVDHCGGEAWPAANMSWVRFRAGLDAHCPPPTPSSPPPILSVESCGDPNPGGCGQWLATSGATMYRTTADLQLYWESVVANLDGNEVMAPLVRPGLWADPDMLILGHPGLSEEEARSHLSGWVVAAAPLGLSMDLVQGGGLSPTILAWLLNKEVIQGINQDVAGVAGVRASAPNPNGGECWAKPLTPPPSTTTTTTTTIGFNASQAAAAAPTAVLLFNRGEGVMDVACNWSVVMPHLPGMVEGSVRDVWEGKDLGIFKGGFTAHALKAHASTLVVVTPVA